MELQEIQGVTFYIKKTLHLQSSSFLKNTIDGSYHAQLMPIIMLLPTCAAHCREQKTEKLIRDNRNLLHVKNDNAMQLFRVS